MKNARESYQQLYILQNLLDSLTEDEILTVSEHIKSSSIPINIIFTLFKVHSQIRPKNFPLFCKIISDFNSNTLQEFISMIEDEIKSIMNQSKDLLFSNSWLFHLISILFTNNVIHNETIESFHFLVLKIPNKDCLFLFSAPLLVSDKMNLPENKELYDSLIKTFDMGPFSYKTFRQYSFLFSLQKECIFPELSKLIEYQSVENSLTYAILYDDTDILIEFSSQPNFRDFLLNMERSGFETKYFPIMPTLICGACFYNSISCFKYFILNNEKLPDSRTMIKDDNEFGNKISRYAVAGGNLEIIRILSQKDVDFSQDLDIAAKYHRLDIFKWIIETNSYDEEIVRKYIQKSARSSFFDYNFSFLEYLFSEYTNDVFDLIQNSFFYSVQTNQVEIICFLVDVMNTFPKTMKDELYNQVQKEPFLICAVDNCSCEMMKVLINNKLYTVNYRDKKGETALHECAIHRFVDGVKFLLSFPDIDVNVQSNSLSTPLHHAARLGFSDIVAILLNHEGIKPDLKDKSSMTPFLLSITSKSLETIKQFIERDDIDFQHYNNNNQNAISIANETNNEEIMSLIQKKNKK